MKLLKANDYVDVRTTPASGDYGVDVLATKDGVKYAVQCKLYSSPVGNHAVHEAFAGCAYYKCDKAVVLTNNEFTKAAQQEANKI